MIRVARASTWTNGMAAVLLAGCASTPVEPQAPDTSPAAAPVRELLADAARARAGGDAARAAAALERALRIDGRNPSIYLALARVRLDQGQPSQAESLARRAMALAPRDGAVAEEADQIIAAARRSAGSGSGPPRND